MRNHTQIWADFGEQVMGIGFGLEFFYRPNNNLAVSLRSISLDFVPSENPNILT
jgi:hypothetical protein